MRYLPLKLGSGIPLLGLLVVFVGTPASGQTREASCACREECTSPQPDPEAYVKIVNRKTPDLILCAVDTVDAWGNWCEDLFNKLKSVDAQVVPNFQIAIEKIKTAYDTANPPGTDPPKKLNVVLGGHGSPGVFCFDDSNDICMANFQNPDPHTPGGEDDWLENKRLFVDGNLPGKPGADNLVKDLTFVSCSVAGDDPNTPAIDEGQAFMGKLRTELHAAMVKAFTGTVWYVNEVGPTDPWQTNGQYVEKGKKNKVPTLPKWGLIGLVVLTAIGGAIIFGRRRTRVGFGG